MVIALLSYDTEKQKLKLIKITSVMIELLKTLVSYTKLVHFTCASSLAPFEEVALTKHSCSECVVMLLMGTESRHAKSVGGAITMMES